MLQRSTCTRIEVDSHWQAKAPVPIEQANTHFYPEPTTQGSRLASLNPGLVVLLSSRAHVRLLGWSMTYFFNLLAFAHPLSVTHSLSFSFSPCLPLSTLTKTFFQQQQPLSLSPYHRVDQRPGFLHPPPPSAQSSDLLHPT